MSSMMTKRERVLAAFAGQETDHVPVCMWKHVPAEYWQDFDRFADCQAAAFHSTGVDFMKLSADGYFGWPSPQLESIENVQDLMKLEPLGAAHPYVREQVERTAKVIRKLNGECVAIYLVFVPLSCLRLRVGYPKMMRFIREDPEAVKYACRVIAEDQKLLVKGILQDAGADGIFYSVQNGEVSRFTEAEYRDWVMPSDREVLDYANAMSDRNVIHFCAWEEEPNRLSVWKDYHAAAVSWSRYMDIMDIREAKKQFGCTVWGGFDNRPGTFLYTASRDEIEKAVADLIREGGRKGYIIGADCSLHNSLQDERIRWVAEAAGKI